MHLHAQGCKTPNSPPLSVTTAQAMLDHSTGHPRQERLKSERSKRLDELGCSHQHERAGFQPDALPVNYSQVHGQAIHGSVTDTSQMY